MNTTTTPEIAVGSKVQWVRPQFATTTGVVLSTRPNRVITGHDGKSVTWATDGVEVEISWAIPQWSEECGSHYVDAINFHGPRFFESPLVTVLAS